MLSSTIALRAASWPLIFLFCCVSPACESQVNPDGDAGGDLLADAGAPTGTQADATPEAEECPRAQVDVPAGLRLNVRPAPSTSGDPIASLPNRAVVSVVSQVEGESIEGETTWLEISTAAGPGFVSKVFAACTTEDIPVLSPPDAFRLPLVCASSATISQGNNSGFSHSGISAYAFDLGVSLGTPLVAMADGIVTYAYGGTGPGHPCYNGGGPECVGAANYVVLDHGDGTSTLYAHLNAVTVNVGEFVHSGVAVGLSGSTGYSTGPHAHVMRQESCGAALSCQSVPVSFADVPGNGVPTSGQSVTSGNCP